MRRLAAAASLSLAVLLVACSGSSHLSLARTSPTPTSPTATPEVVHALSGTTQIRFETPQGARDIDVEVASTPAQSERGLGYRDSLAPDAGMIFDLHETRVPTFWMKGMRFALDMVWIGEDKRVAGVTTNVQPQPGAPDEQLRRYSAPLPVRYVLELNAGAAARLGMIDGAQLTFALP
jgi:uncharacterized membrane protein (UPF0127 family)